MSRTSRDHEPEPPVKGYDPTSPSSRGWADGKRELIRLHGEIADDLDRTNEALVFERADAENSGFYVIKYGTTMPGPFVAETAVRISAPRRDSLRAQIHEMYRLLQGPMSKGVR